tara:strand:+ start:26 stop:634 length:609 start_codon:yes stop_codon:yes gene_type:complete
MKKIPTSIFFINIFFQLISFLKKNNRWKLIFKFSNSIFDLWLLKRTILTSIDIAKNKVLPNKNSYKSFYENILASSDVLEIKNYKIRLSQIESIYYMRNQLLRDSDWASMYHGVELRTPLVDATLLEDLVEVMKAFSLFENKKALRLSFDSILPKNIDFRKKIGFQTPTKSWIKNYVKSDIQSINNDWFSYMKVVSNLFNKN